MKEHRLINDPTIPDGLPIKAMRYLIENNTGLSYEGDMYIGTGVYSTVHVNGLDEEYEYQITRGFMSQEGQPNQILCYDSSLGFQYRYLNMSDFDSSAFTRFQIDPNLALGASKLSTYIDIDTGAFSSSTVFPYAANLKISSDSFQSYGNWLDPNTTYLVTLLSSGVIYNLGTFISPSSSTSSEINTGIFWNLRGSTMSRMYADYFYVQDMELCGTGSLKSAYVRLYRLF